MVSGSRRDVLLVEIRNSCFFYQRLQTVGPLNTSFVHVIIKRTHARKIAREYGQAISMIANDQTPVADQVHETGSSRTLVSGTCDRCVAGVAFQRESRKQVGSIIQAPIEV
jgi:hypothetical protein